ncbi:class I SAM-dependent methyltransferase [Deinococcus marmoris]|uniref:class I SAM-dependent methyltransferase n=1 Tax=Deinococcus marmoris TaxID=249408 RepID=UPI0004964F33|nr:class I SAM-dependent methyltransferase [Deinococcus marmoris]
MSWMFDEHAHAGLEHLTAADVDAYDAKAQVDPVPDVQLLQQRGLSHRHVLIDFGAGTGALALQAALVCHQVIAVDVSPLMLTALRRKAAEQGVTNIKCAEAGFLTYQHRAPPADFVYSRNALHHLPEVWQVQALRRMGEVLKPGGVLLLRDLVYGFTPADTEAGIQTWLQAAPLSAAQGFPKHELETHVRSEFSTYTWLLEVMLDRTGFNIEASEFSASGIFAAYVCRKR